MNLRFLSLLSIACVSVACSSTVYRSPDPTRAAVRDVREQIEAASPAREALTLSEATNLSLPVFDAISEDAARICRTVSEADSCRVPLFEVVDDAHVNARAGYDLQNQPTITLTRGLVEYLADQPDELALVIGHEYGHLITAHVEKRKQVDGAAGNIMSAAASVLAAASTAVGTSGDGRYQTTIRPAYSQREIDEYLEDGDDPEGSYEWFSRGEELEADYIGTYLATRSGYHPTGSAFIEIGALELRDDLSSLEKEDNRLSYSYWDTHTYSPDRAARIQETLEEIEVLKSKGYARPIPPRLIQDIADNNAAFHSLDELVAPLP